MKHYLSILMLFVAATLFGQRDGSLQTECAANAGGDKKICFNDNMTLSAPVDQSYNNPPNIQWTYISGPLPANQIQIQFANQFSTPVLNLGGSATWPTGDYVFRFCVDCYDSNGDHLNDRVCNDATITVKPQVTTPVITELDGQQDGKISGCYVANFDINISSLLGDESYTLTSIPDDPDLGIAIVGNHVTLTTKEGDECQYTMVYTVTNGGCTKSVSVVARFGHPDDPDRDGIITGYIDACPSCTTTVSLIGGIPGCSGSGTWEVIGQPPGSTYSFPESYPGSGFATVSVSDPGHYVFQYTVTNPFCPTSTYITECDILDVDSTGLGASQSYFFCDDTLPVGHYYYCFDYLEDAIYEWYVSHPDIILTVDPVSPNCAYIEVTSPIDLSVSAVLISVNTTKIFVDPDCEENLPYEVVELPHTNIPNETISDIINALWQEAFDAGKDTLCYVLCNDFAFVQLFGGPTPKIKADTTNFLCSQGVEVVKLKDYYTVTNSVSVKAKVTVMEKPACATLPNNISVNQLLSLNVNNCGGCGLFRFRIELTAIDPVTNQETPCKDTFYLTFILESEHDVNAGTDQIHCPDETIRLNGSNDYCYTQGTWTEINCSATNYYQVTIDDIHDPNTEIFVKAPNDTICPPDTLCFVWAFNNAEGNCETSDTTRVFIPERCCISEPCPQRLRVEVKCHEDSVTLTVKDILNDIVDPSDYIIRWQPINQTGNPVTVPYNSIINYTVEIFRVSGGNDTTCYTVLTGIAKCDPTGCKARITETCAPNGDIILSLVDDASGALITPQTGVHEMYWYIYGGGANDNSYYQIQMTNPVTINQGACYSIRYSHFIPYPGTNCTWLLPKTCPSTTCPGPCADFDDFMVAGCGDLLDVSLNLNFSDGCQNVCNNYGSSWSTLGVFHKTAPYDPVTGIGYNILWKNNATTTFVTNNLFLIDRVTITDATTGCVWKDGYTPECPCTTEPTNVRCEQPITKYCRPDGSFYYIVGAPQIIWNAIPGATGYVLEITTGSYDGCCNMPASTYQVTVSTNYWSIPSNMYCFSVRVRAVIPYCSTLTPWSEPYMYCPNEVTCPPIITVCGCCHGERSADAKGLPVQVISEEEMLAYLQANPGTEYATLRDALNAAGVQVEVANEFRVFPNPASERIVIQPDGHLEGMYTVQLTDLLQRRVVDQKFDAANEFSLNVADLPKGVYLLSILNAHGDRMLTEKVTVIK